MLSRFDTTLHLALMRPKYWILYLFTSTNPKHTLLDKSIYHWATWVMPPWTAKNVAYGQKCNLRQVAPMENHWNCCYL